MPESGAIDVKRKAAHECAVGLLVGDTGDRGSLVEKITELLLKNSELDEQVDALVYVVQSVYSVIYGRFEFENLQARCSEILRKLGRL